MFVVIDNNIGSAKASSDLRLIRLQTLASGENG